MADIEHFRAGDLEIEIAEEPTRYVLTWKGKSTDRHPGRTLEPFFTPLLAKAASRKAELEMHFERLVHFNSSTISCLIQIIGESRNAGVKLSLVFDGKLAWQRLSFEALNVFTSNNKYLELRPS